MASFKYKNIESEPSQKMERVLNDLGKDGWELVGVTPIDFKVEGHSDVTSVMEEGRVAESSRKKYNMVFTLGLVSNNTGKNSHSNVGFSNAR